MKKTKNGTAWIIINIVALLPLIGIFSHFSLDFSGTGPLLTATIPQEILNSPRFAGHHLTPLKLPLKSSGEWAIRMLTASLTITPLSIMLGKKNIIRYRKAFGLYAFLYSFLHIVFFAAENGLIPIFNELNFILGLISLLIMIILAATSNRWSMRRMGGAWKKCQKAAYAAALLAILHVVLLSHGTWEIYAAVTGIGFVVRMPAVRKMFGRARAQKEIGTGRAA